MEKPGKTINVLVSITLSKEIPITVYDYDGGQMVRDSDGELYDDTDYSNCDIIGAVESQYVLPHELHKDWDLDEYLITPV